MKKCSFIFRCVTSALVMLLALVFAILEATLLVTLDFALYENQWIACIQLLLRLLIALAALSLGVAALLKRTRSFLPHSLCLFASTLVMAPFVSNSIGLYLAVLAALFLLSEILFVKVRE